MLIQVYDRNVRSFFRISDCDSSSDSAVAARDERDFPFKLIRSDMVFIFVDRTRVHRAFDAGLAILRLRRLPFCLPIA